MLPAVTLPRVVVGLAGAGNGPGLPHLLAGLDVIRLQATACAVFAAAEPGDHQVADDQRRRGDDRALLVVDDGGGPQLLAGCGVDRRQLAVEATDENLAIGVSHTTVV